MTIRKLNQDYESERVCFLSGELNYLLGRYEACLKFLKKCDKKKLEVILKLGKTYNKLNQYRKAYKCL